MWLGSAAALFALGRHAAPHSIDFIVYYRAVKSLIAGRTDLYSTTFSFGPPMTYVYPPLFLLLIFPIGWLSFANAFGTWFAATALATAAAVRAAYKFWRPQSRAGYAWVMLALAGPYVIRALKSGNVQLLIVALTIYGVVEWGRKRRWISGGALALGGAIKLIPLLLVPVFLVRRDWKLILRIGVVSVALWTLPILYFGPRKTAALCQTWYGKVLGHRQGFEKKRALDESLAGSAERLLTRVDYSRYADRHYPEVNFAALSARTERSITLFLSLCLLAASLWMCAQLHDARDSDEAIAGRSREKRIAAAAGIFAAGQILVGPYTPMLYFSGLLLWAAVLPGIWPESKGSRRAILALATLNLALFAVPGSERQRLLQASGAFSLIVLLVWGWTMHAAWLVRKKRPREAGSPDATA